MLNISQTIDTDLLIIGGGIAGLACCVEAHKNGINALLATKTVIGSGASFFPLKATLGIQVTGENDQEQFEQDIARVAKGMNNPKIVRAYIEDSPKAIALLDEIGFRAWLRADNRPACFAQYPRPIFLINEWKMAAERARTVLERQNTPILEQATLLHIVKQGEEIAGAVLEQIASGQKSLIFCRTRQIILASGGIAGLYQDNLYPADVIGSTHAIALKAGACLTNLEFIQFIPAFIEPKYKVLFGEHTLKYCVATLDAEGHSLFPNKTAEAYQTMMCERSGYAPFSADFACVEWDLAVMKHLMEGHRAVYLRYAPALYQDQSEFYQVYLSWLKERVGIDLLTDTVAIAPFAHSCNGGIEIDEFAETAVKGLFAVGEIASGIEGANRLGGNSVGGCLVFAKRAISRVKQHLAEAQPEKADFASLIYQAESALNSEYQGDPTLSASEVLSQMRAQMATLANVYRTGENLLKLNCFLQQLEARFVPSHFGALGLEIANSLTTAQAVVACMMAREESRGAHYRADFPQEDVQAYRLRVKWVNGALQQEKVFV